MGYTKHECCRSLWTEGFRAAERQETDEDYVRETENTINRLSRVMGQPFIPFGNQVFELGSPIARHR